MFLKRRQVLCQNRSCDDGGGRLGVPRLAQKTKLDIELVVGMIDKYDKLFATSVMLWPLSHCYQRPIFMVAKAQIEQSLKLQQIEDNM